MIEVKNLVKKYGDHLAVDHLSFHVDKGQIYGFLGPNGAGKSTTMNIMTGYIASTEGEVVIDGHNILDEPEEAKKCIGYLPEQPPLYFDMTVNEYLRFVAELKKIPRDKREDQIVDIENMVGIRGMKDRLIKNLSKGYKQRVGLAQAILGYPEIIILDEPTVGLDPKQIIEIRELIKSLAKNHTIILSSHILSEVSAVCDYILIINKGKLVASDTTENLERMARGSNTLELSIRGEKQQVGDILNSMEEIRSLQWMSPLEGNVVTLKITTDEQVDVREKIFYKMAEKKLPIMDMHFAKISLEDVFLELTDEKNNKQKQEKKTRKLKDILEKQEKKTQIIESDAETEEKTGEQGDLEETGERKDQDFQAGLKRDQPWEGQTDQEEDPGPEESREKGEEEKEGETHGGDL